jgi:hypothetical protein
VFQRNLRTVAGISSKNCRTFSTNLFGDGGKLRAENHRKRARGALPVVFSFEKTPKYALIVLGGNSGSAQYGAGVVPSIVPLTFGM